MAEIISLAAKRKELRPETAHVHDDMGQVVDSAVNMAMEALKNEKGVALPDSFVVPMEGITHENAAAQVCFKLNNQIQPEFMAEFTQDLIGYKRDQIGHYMFYVKFIPQEEDMSDFPPNGMDGSNP